MCNFRRSVALLIRIIWLPQSAPQAMEKKRDREYTVLDVDFLTVFTAQKFKSLRSDYGRPLGVNNTRVFLPPLTHEKAIYS